MEKKSGSNIAVVFFTLAAVVSLVIAGFSQASTVGSSAAPPAAASVAATPSAVQKAAIPEDRAEARRLLARFLESPAVPAAAAQQNVTARAEGASKVVFTGATDDYVLRVFLSGKKELELSCSGSHDAHDHAGSSRSAIED